MLTPHQCLEEELLLKRVESHHSQRFPQPKRLSYDPRLPGSTSVLHSLHLLPASSSASPQTLLPAPHRVLQQLWALKCALLQTHLAPSRSCSTRKLRTLAMPPGGGGVPMRQPGVPVSSMLGVASMPSSMRVRMALALLPQTRMTCARKRNV